MPADQNDQSDPPAKQKTDDRPPHSKVMQYGPPAGTGAGLVFFLIGLLTEAVEPPWKWAVVVFGALLAVGVWLVPYLKKRPKPNVEAFTVGMIIGTSVGVAIMIAVPPVFRSVSTEEECADPVELSVLVPEDGSRGFESSIADFNEQYKDKNGCLKANVTAYSAAWPNVQNALKLGWEEADPNLDPDDPLADIDPNRDVGPRPDLWLAESMAQVQAAEEWQDGIVDADAAEPIGSSPLVVAVPKKVFEEEFEDEVDGDSQLVDSRLIDLIDTLREDHDLPMVRPDPAASYTALTFLKYLYESDPDDLVQLENQFASAITQAGLAHLPRSDTDLLCNIAQKGPDPSVALLTTERALSRYNDADSFSESCPVDAEDRPVFFPVYIEGMGSLDYQAVRMNWPDPWSDARSEVARELVKWLAKGAKDIGIRPEGASDTDLEGSSEFLTTFELTKNALKADDHEDYLGLYRNSRVPTNVLVAIDGSKSMGVEVRGEDRTRFELAVEGYRAALGNLRPGEDGDGVGLWTFPVSGEESVQEVLELSSDHENPAEALDPETYKLVYGLGFRETVIAGVDELEQFSLQHEPSAEEKESVEAMVVLTDGAELNVDDAEAVREKVDGSQVSLYVIAVGDASCRAEPFSEMDASPRITCLDAHEEQIRTTFDGLFRQLWG